MYDLHHTINNVRNLDEVLNNDNNPRTLLTTTDRSPPHDHAIVNLTNSFRFSLREKALDDIQPLNEFYLESLKPNPEFHQYDCSKLRPTRQAALKLLNSYIAASTPLTASPPPTNKSSLPPLICVCQFQASQTSH